MKCDDALAQLKRHEAELRRLGVVSLSLFGSTARDEAGSGSDIDVVVELDDRYRGFAAIGLLDDIRERLSRLLGAPVDVVPEPGRSSRIKAAIDRDRRLAF